MKRFTRYSALALGILGLTLSLGAQAQPRIAFVPQIKGIPYYVAMKEGGQRAAERFDLEYVQQGPTSTNAADQLRVFQGFINRGFDVVAVSPVEVDSLKPAIQAATARGTHIITADADAPGTAREFFVAQALDKELGAVLMDELAERIDKKGKVAIISDAPTIQSLNNWIDAIKKRADGAYPDIEIVSTQHTDGTTQRAYQYASDAMTRFPDLKAIIGIASTTCPGVAQAVQEAGKIGEVITTGYCSPNTVRDYIKSGAMPFSVLWNPADLGYLTAWAGMQLSEGESFSASNEVPGLAKPVKWLPEKSTLLLGPPLVITPDNVDKFDF